MSNAEARAWWTDVEHLRPDAPESDAAPVRRGRITGRPLRVADAPAPTAAEPRTEIRDAADAAAERMAARPRFARGHDGEGTAAPRRSRDGESDRSGARRTRGAEPCMGRADAAGFADALDLDGAFGSPRGAGPVSREIVLTRGDAVHEDAITSEHDAVEDIPAPRRRALAEVASRDIPPREEASREHVPTDLAALERAADHDALLAPRDRYERGPDGRRTVQIRGHAEPAPQRRLHELERRRPARRPVDRFASRPDRIALYAVLLGIFLVIIAAASSSAQAATLGF